MIVLRNNLQVFYVLSVSDSQLLICAVYDEQKPAKSHVEEKKKCIIE